MLCAAIVLAIILQNVQAVEKDYIRSDDDQAPECIPAVPHPLCSILGSLTGKLLINTDEIDVIFETLSQVAFNHTQICTQFIIFSLCFYSFRDCDDNGAQLLICEDVCPQITQLYNDCISFDVVQALIDSTDNEVVEHFLEFALQFECSKNETYVIEDVPISQTCNNFSYIQELFPTEEVTTTLKPDESDDSDESSVYVKIGLGVGVPLLVIVVVVIGLLILVFKLHRTKTQLERRVKVKRNQYNPDNLSEMAIEVGAVQLSVEERCFYEERFDKALISYDQLQMEDNIGEGTFGVVFRATLLNGTSTTVAVKKPHNLLYKDQLRSLLKESLVMKRFNHINVVGLLGMCFDTPDGYPYLVLPFMANGNIRDYLKAKRLHITETDVLPDGISLETMKTMCIDIANGMEYLSSNKFVHRDLAARNCMLDEHGTVKVGDFGLARDIYAHLYYRGDRHSKIPVKWSAPETLNDGLCTTMSDVWSYGIVCWEIFSLGSNPYPGVNNYDIPQYIMSGERLIRPPLCPLQMYRLMEKCWEKRPEARPDFKEIVTSLADRTH